MAPEPTDRRPRWVRALLWAGYGLAVVAVALVALEATARALGLGDPVLYHTAVAGGLRPLPGQSVERVGGARVTVDANGVRSASTTADTAALRVLYLGDSVTWGGSRIDDAATFAEVAAEPLRAAGPVYAMNAGVNATAMRNAAEVYAAYADTVDAVVWLFPWADAFRAYTTLGPLWPARQKPRFALVEAVDLTIFQRWVGAFRVGGRGPAFTAGVYPPGFEAVARAEQVARLDANTEAGLGVVRDAAARGLPVVVGVTPWVGADGVSAHSPEVEAFLADAEALGAVVFDVRDLLDDAGPEGLFYDTVHFTDAGHRVVGEALAPVLARALRP